MQQKVYGFIEKHSRLLFGFLTLFVLLIGIYLVHSLFIELTTPDYNFYGTHHDFMAFYTAGKNVLQHNVTGLYDANNMIALQREIIPHPVGATGYMPFLNPPFMAALLAPLALMSINVARLVWLAISIPLAIFIIFQLVKPLKSKQRLLAISLLIFSYPMFQTFIEGQLSILVLLGGCLSYIFLKRDKKFLSGASLALLWILPQFGVFALLGVLVKREWTILKGWFLASVGLIAVTLPITGIGIYFTYIKVLTSTTGNHFVNMNTSANLAWRGALSTASGFNAFFDILIGPNHTRIVNLIYAITSFIFVGLLAFAVYKVRNKWISKKEVQLFVAGVIIACLIDPHLYAQDIIVLFMILPALITLFKKNAMKAIIIFAVILNLALFDQYLRLHWFTIFTALVAIIFIQKSLNEKPFQIKKLEQ